jgi:hypothetical protein
MSTRPFFQDQDQDFKKIFKARPKPRPCLQDQDQDLSSQDETKTKIFKADAYMLKSKHYAAMQ